MIRNILLSLVLLAAPFAFAEEQASVALPVDESSLVADVQPSFFSPKTESDVAAMAALQLEDLHAEPATDSN